MYLKKLTIQGFKSFATRTTFEFGRGVTAVVGPNGSGKSNVADAIRWVLGEQSSRLLRARRQEDVIFAGGGQRSAVGMAEVTLTLDNEDGWLPLEFNEIELGRRLYRDGDSEYLLNGSRVRLRDLTDLLLRGQVGQNSYTIMGQGLVDEVLVMSALERRGLVDEAADVRRYRVRVREAQDRLAATRANLDRVELVLRELEPRLKQLRRQAERASDHARLARELMELLQAYFGETWAETQNRLTRARANLDQRNAETQEAKEKLDSSQAQLRTLGEEIKKRREALAQRDARGHELNDSIAATERDLALDGDRLLLLDERIGERQKDVADLRSELAELPGTDEAEQGEPESLGLQLAAAEERIAACRTTLDEAEAASAAVRAHQQELETGAMADRREQGLLAAQLESLSEQRDRVDRAQAEAMERRALILSELRGYATRFETARVSLRSAESRVDAARLAAEDTRQRLAAAEERRRGNMSRGDQRELDLLRARLEVLQRIQAEMIGLAAGARHALMLGLPNEPAEESADPAVEIEGVLGLLSQLLKVPAKLEVAINAALENRLHAVVIESEDEAYRTIAILRQEQGGRATLLPLDGMRHVYPLNLSKEKGLVGVASKLVRCDDRLRPLIDTLLGRVIIVEDVETGLRTVKRGLGSVVTLDGTLIEPNGIVTGGATGADDEPFLRLRELEELPARIGELEQRSADAPAGEPQEDSSLADIARKAQEATAAYEDLLRELAEARAAVEKERSALHRLRRDMAALQSRREGLARESERVAAALLEAERALAAIESRGQDLEERRARIVTALQEAEERTAEAMSALSQATAERAAIEGERKAASAAHEQLDRQHRRLSAQIEARQGQLADLARERQAAEERIAAHKADLEALKLEQSTRVDDLAPVRDELLRLESHERQVSEDVQAAQSDLLTHERARLDLESEVERLTDHLESLRQEMAREGLAPDRTGRILPFAERAPSTVGPQVRGGAPLDLEQTRRRLDDVRRRIRRLGPVNQEAPEDLQELEDRHRFLSAQVADLTEAQAQLREVIDELNAEIKKRFGTAFKKVDSAFGDYFTAFFGGGSARLSLTAPGELAETGIDIEAQPPGKKVQSLSLLSGGERSLTAVALLFALLTVNPAPFCVLDEVDAALDEANVGRFTGSLARLATNTQFLVVTHNRRTIEQADAIYGVSMGKDSISKVLSVRLDEITESGTVDPNAGG